MPKPPFRRNLRVYQVERKIIINSYCRTRAGIGIGMPVIEVLQDGQPEEIGRAVLKLIAGSFDDAPDVNFRDPSFRVLPSDLLVFRAAGVKTSAALHKKSKTVSCIENAERSQIEVIPDKKVQRWSEWILEKTRFSSYDPDELGKAVLLALADSG